MRRIKKYLISLLFVGLFVGYNFMGLQADTRNIYDEENLLTQDELLRLEEISQDISDKYGVGVYAFIIYDYNDYGYSIHDAAINIYYDNNFDKTEDSYLLILSMSERDYWLLSKGSFANYALNDYAREKLTQEFLDDFRYDDFYEGFLDYLNTSEKIIEMARMGKPYDVIYHPSYKVLSFGLAGVLALIIAFIINAVLKANMRSVFVSKKADYYMVKNDIRMTVSKDVFTHNTETVTRIPKTESSFKSGGSGGFKGSGGKF